MRGVWGFCRAIAISENMNKEGFVGGARKKGRQSLKKA